MNNILEHLKSFAENFGFFVVGGATGAVIHRLRNKMTIKRFIASIFISMFVSLCVGVIVTDYFALKESIVYVLCGISGVFSNTILDEIEEGLENLSDAFRKKIGLDEKDTNPTNSNDNKEGDNPFPLLPPSPPLNKYKKKS